MLIALSSPDAARARRELMLLFVASLSVVAFLTMTLAGSFALPATGLELKQVGAFVLICGVALFSLASIWQLNAIAQAAFHRARAEQAKLRTELATAETLVAIEPQVVVIWEPQTGVRLMRHSLKAVPGLPSHAPDLLKFGVWLDRPSAEALKLALDALFAKGAGFTLLLKTEANGHLEADGRAMGASCILRLRDIQGVKRDLVRVLDRQQGLKREIEASRALLDCLPMPVWLKDDVGRLEWVNASYVAAVDAKGTDEVLLRQIELLDSRQRASLETRLGLVPKFSGRMPLVVAGNRRTHDVIAVGLPSATMAAAFDQTAIEIAERELNRQTEAYGRTLDRVSTAVAIFNAEGELTYHNRAYAQLWQLDAAYLLGRPKNGEILDRLRQLSRLPADARWKEWKERALARSTTEQPHEDWWHLPDGRIVHVRAQMRPDGGLTYLFDDSTEQLALESRFKTLINVQRETLDSLNEAVAVFGPDGKLKLFNSGFAAIWRLSPDKLDQSPHIAEIVAQAKVLYEGAEAWPKLITAVTAIEDSRQGLRGEMARADGSVIDYAATPLPDGATLIVFVDVSATRRYEQTLIERNEALVAGDRLKNQFIGHVSYELRTPLTNIIGFGELMSSARTGPLNAKQREYMDDIQMSSRTLLSIIDDILDLATIDAGALELKLAPVDVQALVDAAIEGVRERAARAELTIEVELPETAPALMADGARLRQIIYNLLANAVGFSNRGGRIRVAVWCEADMLKLAVEDEGQGIALDEQAQVFDRFVSRGRGGQRGAGLGLSLVKSLVELHGGNIQLASEPGLGTQVVVALPLAGGARA